MMNDDDDDKARLCERIVRGELTSAQLIEHGLDPAELAGWLADQLAESRALAARCDSLATNLSALIDATDGAVITIPTGTARGARWIIDRSYPTQFARGDWDLAFQQVLAALLREGDVFFDVGANAGFHMLVGAALVGATGRVIGFEPLDTNCRMIDRVLELNPRARCEVARCAVGDKLGEVTFFEHPLNALGSTVPARKSRGGKEYRVPATTLDAFVAERAASLGRPSAIKIDVEGAEALVIAGAQAVLAHDAPPALVIELHEPKAGAAVIRRVTEHGFAHAWLDGEAATLDELSTMRVGHIVAVARRDPRLVALRDGIGASWRWRDA